ncbi:hypothetical protein NDI76_19340 [Halogeometricum sp. S1BR25-6]|uniref:GIY-YIG domain-containing protein n=1 Tax=Halogeometricum salsisoli TaxID=2950536 RepID=A0ABU2GKH1_9EURY|nr:hypothetical protein [Halogeometricum sp. S1BR25-6]MDS0300906.1 hypothetical protein [Halogeometricum sp. S1BR25-6]
MYGTEQRTMVSTDSEPHYPTDPFDEFFHFEDIKERSDIKSIQDLYPKNRRGAIYRESHKKGDELKKYLQKIVLEYKSLRKEPSYLTYIIQCEPAEESKREIYENFFKEENVGIPNWFDRVFDVDRLVYVGMTELKYRKYNGDKTKIQRFLRHLDGCGANFTGAFKPQHLLGIIPCDDEADAKKIENRVRVMVNKLPGDRVFAFCELNYEEKKATCPDGMAVNEGPDSDGKWNGSWDIPEFLGEKYCFGDEYLYDPDASPFAENDSEGLGIPLSEPPNPDYHPDYDSFSVMDLGNEYTERNR